MKGIQRIVTKVIDGDTFLIDKKIRNTNTVQLAGIGAPELFEKGGIQARNKLRRLIEGKTVTIVPVKKSKHA